MEQIMKDFWPWLMDAKQAEYGIVDKLIDKL